MLRGVLAQNSQQWSDFPPPGKKRGMYIDEAHNFVFALKNTYNPTTGTYDYSVLQELVDVITRKRLRYVALYNLDMGDYYGNAAVTPVLMDPDTWPALSALIGYLKSQQDSLEVGVVLSIKDSAAMRQRMLKAYAFNFGTLFPFFTGHSLGSSMIYVNPYSICKSLWDAGIVMPPFPDKERFEQLSQDPCYGMLGMMTRVLLYNYGRGNPEETEYYLSGDFMRHFPSYVDSLGKVLLASEYQPDNPESPFSTLKKPSLFVGYPHKFDWLNIEWEYWNSPSKYNSAPNYPYQTNRDLWEAYVRLLKHARYVKCLSRDRLKLESYVLLDPNIPGIYLEFNGACWANNNNPNNSDQGVEVDEEYHCVTYNWDIIVDRIEKCPPNGFIQASVLDEYLDRVFITNYFNLHEGITKWSYRSFFWNRGLDPYFLGSPQSGHKTEVWPLFSLEYPLLGQLSCIYPPKQIPCRHQYLGLALEPGTICIDTVNGANICQDSPYSDPVFVYPGCGMNLSFRDVEAMWLNGYGFARDTIGMCDNGIEYWNTGWHNGCFSSNNSDLFFGANVPVNFVINYFQHIYDSIGSTYSANVAPYDAATNPLGNDYGGFMYYTYSIQKCKPNYRKQSAEPENSTVMSQAYLISRGESLLLNLGTCSGNFLKWTLTDNAGRVVKGGSAGATPGILDISTSGLSPGSYYLHFYPHNCISANIIRIIVH